jgi:hypothetical protein
MQSLFRFLSGVRRSSQAVVPLPCPEPFFTDRAARYPTCRSGQQGGLFEQSKYSLPVGMGANGETSIARPSVPTAAQATLTSVVI